MPTKNKEPLEAEPGYHFDQHGHYIKDETGERLCGARTRRKGTPCHSRPMPNGRCRLHGGKTPGGMFSPNFKHGRYSKYLPEGLAERYQAAANDPEIINLKPEIALIDTRLASLIERLAESEPVGKGFVFALADLWEKFLAADNGGRELERLKLRAAIGDMIENGTAEYQVWMEIANLIEQRRRLSESEVKRIVAGEHVLSIERVWIIITLISKIINDNVSSNDERAAIAAEFRKQIVAAPSGLA